MMLFDVKFTFLINAKDTNYNYTPTCMQYTGTANFTAVKLTIYRPYTCILQSFS